VSELLRFPLDGIRSLPEDLVLTRKSRVWSRTVFSAGSQLETPVVVEVLAHQSRDKPFFGDIVAQGPGVEQHGVRNPMVGERGTVVVTNDNMISYRVTERGEVFYMLRNSALMATLDPETLLLAPCQHYILVRENERAALALSSRGPIWVPTMDMETDDESTRHNSGLRAEYGEVIAVGPGRWQDGQLQKPSCQAGDMLLYDCSHSTLAVSIRGERFTLVACTQEAMVYRDAASTPV
jgi:co-chaperonin GroES (HSP10)